MSASAVQHVTSRDNALMKDLRRLSQDSTAYRRQQRVWLEGDHLCRAAAQRGVKAAIAVFAESAFDPQWESAAERLVVVPDAIFAGLSALDSPAKMAFVLDMPSPAQMRAGVATVLLDGVQDAGNVGSILRCAAAFGFAQVVAMKGTAALWSPKVLRAGMGAHFALSLLEGFDAGALSTLGVPLLATSSHEGELLHEARLPWPCAWVFGHEGRGVSRAVAERATGCVRIAQPGGEESLNVAAAAAICLHASAAKAIPK
ncbi:MAG TPA: RNA methyltransferase [Ramlibacter sp.]|uniref:TrmH family RNA methyltransferase n=1 Tax=Ramlibacter sp. TaxID=1917967 RepID=UPI002B8C58D3|nr:RNA methyltransferase [Ramlibacter sp.]HVZ43079.1 RNA methyltransferase [Ramlibacter sp.]